MRPPPGVFTQKNDFESELGFPVHNPAVKAGDLVIFNEATLHGTLPWRNTDHETRRLLYRYCPEHVNFHGGTLCAAHPYPTPGRRACPRVCVQYYREWCCCRPVLTVLLRTNASSAGSHLSLIGPLHLNLPAAACSDCDARSQFEQPSWVSELTLAQQSTLEPPYRYNRVTVENDGSVKAHGQNSSFSALYEKVKTLEDGIPPVQVRDSERLFAGPFSVLRNTMIICQDRLGPRMKDAETKSVFSLLLSIEPLGHPGGGYEPSAGPRGQAGPRRSTDDWLGLRAAQC